MAKERLAILLAGVAVLAAPALAQDDRGEQEAPDTEVSTEPDESEANDEVEVFDDPELDAQGFDPTADDDFVPSEEIPADEPISFPTDI